MEGREGEEEKRMTGGKMMSGEKRMPGEKRVTGAM